MSELRALLVVLPAVCLSTASRAQQMLQPVATSGYMQTPEGLAPRSCVYQIPNGAALAQDGTVFLNAVRSDGSLDLSGPTVHSAPCTEGWTPTWLRPGGRTIGEGPDAGIGGYQTEVEVTPSYFPSGYQFTEFSGTYTVPSLPIKNDDGQILYIFGQVQDANGDVVQPMLYNFGDGTGWWITTWYFGTTQQSYPNWENWYGPSVQVNCGDTVSFTALQEPPGDGWWVEAISDSNTHQGVTNWYQVYNDRLMNAAFPAAIEVYGVNYCEELPSTPTTFTNLAVYDGPNYSTYNNVNTTSTWTPGWDTTEAPDCFFFNQSYNAGGNYSDSLALGGGLLNGGFESGNQAFGSSYAFVSPPSLINNVAQYAIGPDPSKVSIYGDWEHFGDHTTGFGNMFIANGASTAGTAVFSETLAVQPNTNYILSFWGATVNATSYSQSTLQASINGVNQGGALTLPLNSPATGGEWVQRSSTWYSGSSTSAQITIADTNLASSWNDFALDDITFAPGC